MRAEWIRYAFIREINRIGVEDVINVRFGNSLIQLIVDNDTYTMCFDSLTISSIREITSSDIFWNYIKENSLKNEKMFDNEKYFTAYHLHDPEDDKILQDFPAAGLW